MRMTHKDNNQTMWESLMDDTTVPYLEVDSYDTDNKIQNIPVTNHGEIK